VESIPTEQSTAETATSAAAVCSVAAGVDDLLIGRPLKNAVFDENGLLLLAEGCTITPEFKRLLKVRRVESVKLHPDDARDLVLNEDLIDDVDDTTFETAMTQNLDKVVDSGLLPVHNAGPAIRESMIDRRQEGYDAQRQEQFAARHTAAASSLDSMIQMASRNQTIDGTQVGQLAAGCLADLTEDGDNLLAVAMEAAKCGAAEQSLKTAVLAMALGAERELDANNIRTIGISGLVSDWGMVKIPERIRSAEHVLSSTEFLAIQQHPVYTLDILERISEIPRLVPLIAYQVHECPNGSGYPRGRSGRQIHPFAALLHVADIYVALTTPKPYRPALMPYAALECLLQMAGAGTADPRVVRTLMNTFSLFPIGSLVAISDGSVAKVIRRNGDQYTSPIVQVIRNPDGDRIPPGRAEAIVDLAESDLSVMQAVPRPGRNEIGLRPDIVSRPRR